MKILLQAAYVFDRHSGYLLENVGYSGDTVGKGNHAHPMLNNLGLIAHSDTSYAGNSGETPFQGLYMVFKLNIIGQQHDKLGIVEALESFLQIASLTHTKKLFHTVLSLRVLNFFIILESAGCVNNLRCVGSVQIVGLSNK